MTFGIQLVNMPFGGLCSPSIALTQLKTATELAHGDKVSIDICYLNHDFGRILGAQFYEFIASSTTGHTCGLGEWLFRLAAFPEEKDNVTRYFRRYGSVFGRANLDGMIDRLMPFRAGLDRTLDELIERYRLHEAQMVGLTSMFFQNLPSIALARRLRLVNPSQVIVMGGANCEGPMGIELVNNVPILDFVFSGHSLMSFPKFVGHLLAGEADACHGLNGVFSRRNSRSISTMVGDPSEVEWTKMRTAQQLTGITALGPELDINTPLPLDYDPFIHSLKTVVGDASLRPSIMFETSRGCWWGERAHCTFCGLNGGTMSYRSMQPERALALIEGLIERYSGVTPVFESVDNIMPKEYFDGVFAKLRPPAHVRLFYEVKADLTDEQVRILASGGVRHIQPGIEALATSTLKLMRKGTTAFHGIRLLASCKAYGITPSWNLLVGFPGETAAVYETYAKLLPSLYHLPPPSGVFPVRFDRFSPYFVSEKEYGLNLVPADYYDLCYPFPASVLRNMAYYFQDTNYEAPYVQDTAVWLPTLRVLTERWKTLWDAAQGPPRLAMSASSSGGSIEDTRDGTSRNYLLGIPDMDLLTRLDHPEREEGLAPEHAGALESARRNSLLFSERGRVLSLVAQGR